MSDELNLQRRAVLALGAAATAAMATPALSQTAGGSGLADMKVLDTVRPELVMNLVVTCSQPEPMGPTADAPDGKRGNLWPIIGGRFQGPDIKGEVIPGGGDFPVRRPDGVTIVDALYRLRTDDGFTIIIHNRGYAVGPTKYRLTPQFIVNAGKYDWLNKGIFVATLIYGDALPAGMRLAKGPNENDRLIQVHRLV